MKLRLRYRLGTTRLRATSGLRRLHGRLLRDPRSATIVPAPRRLRRGERPLGLARVVVACDLNPHYLAAWELAARAWSRILGVEPTLVLVASPEEVPAAYRADDRVRVFAPLRGVHTALQAQCIRLLYPALLPDDGAVVTTDVDMVPMNSRYFRRPLARIPRDHFVAYRDVLLPLREMPICYNAALPSTWGEIFDVATLDDVRERLAEWTSGVAYDGVRGGEGWITDQRILHDTLIGWGRSTGRLWILDDWYTGHRRLERQILFKPRDLDDRQRRAIERRAYSDFHLLLPYSEWRDVNDRIVDLGIAAAAPRAGPSG